MERRAFPRKKTGFPVKYLCDTNLYSGTVTNISANGMFIATLNFLPCMHSIEIMVPLEKEVSRFDALIRRIDRVNEYQYNIGVEILDPSGQYEAFVNNLQAVNH